MSTNLGGVESSMRVSLEGIEEARKQFADLRKDAKNLESVKGKVELDVQQIDVDGLMQQVKRAEKEIKASLKRALKAEADFSGISRELNKEFGNIDASHLLAPIQKQVDATKGVLQSALSSVQKMSKDAKVALADVGSTMFSASDAQRVNNTISTIQTNITGLSTAMQSVAKDFGAEIAQINNTGAKMFSDTLKQQRIVVPGLDGSIKSELQAIVPVLTGVSDQSLAMAQSVNVGADSLEKMAAGSKDASAGLDLITGELKSAGGAADSAAQRMISFEHVAHGLGGRMSKMFDVGGQKMLKAVDEVVTHLREAGTNQEMFAELFSPEILMRVEELRVAFERLDAAKSAITASGSSVDAAQLKEFADAQRDVLRVREEIANTSLRMNANAGVVGNIADIEAYSKIVGQVEKYKSGVEHTLALLGRYSDVLANEEALHRNIVNIIKAGGDAELETLAARRSNADAIEQQATYAKSLLAAERELAALPQTASALDMRRELAATAAKSYSSAAMASEYDASAQQSGKMTMMEFTKEAINARTIVEAIDAQKAFRAAVLDSVGAVEMGLAPSMDKVTASVQKYAALSSDTFKANTGDVQALILYLHTMEMEYDKARGKGTLASNRQASSILSNLTPAVSIAADVATDDHVKRTAATQLERIKLKQQSLDITIAEQTVTEKIGEDLAKLLLYQKAGVNSVGNMMQMQKVYLDAMRQGLSVEDSLAAAATNKASALRSVYKEYLQVNKLASDATLTEAQQLEMRKAAMDLLRMAVPLQRELGAGVKVGKTSVSGDSLQQLLLSNQLDVVARERQLALSGQLKNSEAAINGIIVERKRSENEIINTLVRARDITQAGLTSRETYEAAVKAQIEAERRGLDISDERVNLVEMQKQALSGMLSEQQRLLVIMENEKNTALTRNEAARQLLDINKQIRAVAGDKSVAASAGFKDAETRYAAFKGTAPQEKAPTTIADVANLTMTQAQITERVSAQASKLAESMKKAKEEILSGTNVLQNFKQLQDLIVQASEAGVSLDAETLQLLTRQDAVMKSLVASAKNILEIGNQSADTGIKARAYTRGKELFNAASSMASPGEAEALGLQELQSSLSKLRSDAGKALPGSLQAMREDADKIIQQLTVIDSKMSTITQPTSKSSFDATRNNLERILPLMSQLLQKEQEITRTEEFRESSDAEMDAQYKKIANLERMKTLITQIRAAQDKYAAAGGRLGIDSDTLYSPNVRAAAVKAAGATGDHKAYGMMAESAKNVMALTRELARAAQETGVLDENTKKFLKSIRDSVRPAKEISDSLALSAKSQASKASQQAGQDMFDPNRMAWFMQLRMFWSGFTNIQQTVQQAVDFAHTLNVVRSVAQTTAAELRNINAEFDTLSTIVPIAYKDMASAVLEVAKAGFTAEDALTIVSNSAKLAQATGDELKKVADLQTVILHAWGLGAEQSEKIADQLYNAVAKSRADISGLDSALGYVAGIAPQANVSVGETLAMMGILSNAGLAMSKSGTYMRQFLNDLMNPSEKLIGILNKLGVAVSDVDPRFNKISDVFRLLASRGMDVTDAFEGMSIRAASAFSIMLKNADYVDAFTDSVNASGAVNEAYQHTIKDFTSAMGFFQNQMVQTANTWGDIFGPLFGGLLRGIGEIVMSFNSLGKSITDTTSLFGVGASSFVTNLISMISGLYALQKASVIATTSLNKLGLGTFGAVKGFNALRFATLGWIGVAIAAAAAAAALWKHFHKSEADMAVERIEKATAAVEELRNASNGEMEIKLKVTAEKTRKDDVVAAEQIATQAGQQDRGGVIVTQTLQERVLSEALASGDDDKKAAAEQAREFIVNVDMDFDAAEKAAKQFFDIFRELSEKSAKTLPEELQNGIDKATDKAKKALISVRDDVAGLESVLSKSNKDMSVANVYGAGVQGLTQGFMHTDAQSILKDIRGEGFFGSAIEADEKSLARLDARVRSFYKDYMLDSTEVDKVRDVADLPTRLRMYEALLAKQKEIADSSDFFIPAKPSADNASTLGFVSEMATAFVDVQNALKGIEALAKFEVGDEQSVERLHQMLAELTKMRDVLTKSGVKQGADYGMFKQITDMEAYVKSRFPAHKKAVDDNKKKMEEASSTGENTTQAQARATNSVATDLENRSKALASSLKSTKLMSDITSMMPSDEGLSQLSTSINTVRGNYQDLISVMQKLTAMGGFEALSADAKKSIIDATKQLYEASEKEMDLQGVENGTKRLVSIAKEIAGMPVNMGLDYTTILKQVDAGKKAYDTIKNMGGGDIGDSIGDIIGKSVKQWQEAMSALGEKGFFEYHHKIRQEVLKTYNFLSKIRSDLDKSIKKNTTAISEYSAAVQALSSVRSILQEVSAESLAAAESADKVSELSGKLLKVNAGLEDTRDVAKEARSMMNLFAGQVSIPKEVVDQMTLFADSARGRLDEATKSAEELKKEIMSLSQELLKLNLEAKKSDFEFQNKLRSIDQQAYRNPQNAYAIDQSNLNRQRTQLGALAPSMSAEELKAELQSMQSALLEFYGQYQDTNAGRAARTEAKAINDDINALNQAIKTRVEAELTMKVKYYDEVTTLLSDIKNAMLKVNENLVTARTQSVEQLATLNTTGALAKQSGAKEPSYSSSAVPKRAFDLMHQSEGGKIRGGNPTAIGYDKKGGTSYGTGQIASAMGNVEKFIKFLSSEAPEVAKALREGVVSKQGRDAAGDLPAYNPGMWNTGSSNKSGAGPAAWIEVAGKFGQQFTDLQNKFLTQLNIAPAFEKILQQSGVDLNKASVALQGVTAAMANQHGQGRAPQLFAEALKAFGGDKSKVDTPEFINKLYDLRTRRKEFSSSTPEMYNNVVANLTRERRNALNMYAEQKRNPGAFEEKPVAEAVKEGVVAGMQTVATPTAPEPIKIDADRQVTPEQPSALPRIQETQSITPSAATGASLAQSVEQGLTSALAKASASTGGASVKSQKDELLTMMETLKNTVPTDMQALMLAVMEKIKASTDAGASEIANMVFAAFEKPTKTEIADELKRISESLMLVSKESNLADTSIGQFAEGVTKSSGEFAAAKDAYLKASAEAQARAQELAKRSTTTKQVDGREQYIMPGQALTSYAQTWEAPNKATQRTFNALADDIHTGLSSAIVTAMKTVGTDDNWLDAVEDVIENMTWQMIDTWIQTQMKMLSQGLWSKVGEWAGVVAPPEMKEAGMANPDGTMKGDMGQFTHWWGGDRANDFAQPQVAEMVAQESAIPDAFDAVANTMAGNAATDAANLMTEQTLQAAEQGMQVAEQTMQTTDQVLLAQQQTDEQIFAQAVTQLSSVTVPSLNAAAEALIQAAGAIAGGGGTDKATESAGFFAGLFSNFGGGGGGGGGGAGGGGNAFAGRHEGGIIPGYAFGGLIMSGNKHEDSTLIAATKGEFMIQEPAVRAFGSEFFRKLNEGHAEQAFQSLAFPSPALSGAEHMEPDSARISDNGRINGRSPMGGRNEGLKIMNIQDPRMIETYLASPRGSKIVQNLAMQGVGKVIK